MAAPVTVVTVLTRPSYGEQFYVGPTPNGGRVQATLSMPAQYGSFAPFTDPIEISNVWYVGTDDVDEVLFSPSSFAYWGWIPIGATLTLTANPAADNAALVTAGLAESHFCGNMFVIGPGYDSRDATAQDESISAVRFVAEDDVTLALGIQSHQFREVSIGVRNLEAVAGVVSVSILDAETLREIASTTVAISDSDTIVLTAELPDAIILNVASAAGSTAGALVTVRGVRK